MEPLERQMYNLLAMIPLHNIISTIVVFLSCLLCYGCQETLNPRDYIHWVQNEEHGMHVTQIQEGIFYEVQYKPLDYMILQRNQEITDSLEAASLLKEIQGLQYYSLSFGLEDRSSNMLSLSTFDESERQKLLYYFSYLFKDDIHLVEDGKRLPCRLFHFERSYGLKNTNTAVLAFDSSEVNTGTATLVVHPKIFDVSPVEIKINKKNIPQLLL